MRLADIFQEVKDVFILANPKRLFNWFDQLSWRTFIRDACLLKYKALLEPDINNKIPQNHNIQEENIKANRVDKSNSNTNIQKNNSMVETSQYINELNNSNNSKVINSKKREIKSSTISNKTKQNKTKKVNRAVVKRQ